MTGETRRREIRAIHRKYRLFYELFGGAVLLLIGVAIGAGIFGVENQNYHMNLATEALGIAATVFIINRWYAHRDRERQREEAKLEEERRTEELKQSLVRRAGNRTNNIAIAAIEQLRDEGLLTGDDGWLKGAFLLRANLKNANLNHANLQGAIMLSAELQGAMLLETDLRSALLDKADLRHVASSKANLSGAFVHGANLQYARLWEANLQGARLPGTYLQGAQLGGANLKNAVLPDNTTALTENVDLERFTNAGHPEFPETLKKIELMRWQIMHG